MLRLSEIRDAYERSSAKLSEINRQLCFAGFALVWIFNKTSTSLSIPDALYLPLLCWCLSLTFDVLQYAYKTGFWYFFYLRHKKPEKSTDGLKSEDDMVIDEPESPNFVTWILFIIKIVSLIIGYVMTALFLWPNGSEWNLYPINHRQAFPVNCHFIYCSIQTWQLKYPSIWHSKKIPAAAVAKPASWFGKHCLQILHFRKNLRIAETFFKNRRWDVSPSPYRS